MKTRLGPAKATAIGAALLMMTAGCSSGGGFGGGGGATPTGGGTSTGPLTVLIGSSGPAETKAVTSAAAAFTKQTGIKVTVIPAQNLTQQLAQGFAANQAPDVFYLDPVSFQSYAKKGALYAYAGQVSNPGDFYPALKAAFTYNNTFTCVPKDWSTLGLAIDEADWTAAGLTDADVPTTWSQLETVAKKLSTAGRTGLVLAPDHTGVDDFMYQNGGTLLSDDKATAAFNSTQNTQALTFVKTLLTSGAAKFPAALSAGWNGEAFGENKAAMTIVGNWLAGTMSSDYPNVKYKVVPLPAGPSGTKATLSFTNCWGIPASDSKRDEAVKLVDYLSSASQQMTFAKEFGVMPSRESDASAWTAAFPAESAFLQGASYAHPDLAIAGGTQTIANYDSLVAQLASSDPATVLSTVQTNFEALIKQNG
ncbi:MAG TPA: extracellular solute-binding protein [Actinospica sp.]|nr:extracellular solute-binding protein [Actinospica sp.]